MNSLKRNEQCPDCGRFSNRGVSIDAVIIQNNQILLVKRGAEPEKGKWATPGGFVDWDESVEETVIREVKEETSLTVVDIKLVGVYSSPDRHPRQVINIVYVVRVEGCEAKCGDDADEVKWFPLGKLPENLAFDHAQNIIDAQKLITK